MGVRTMLEQGSLELVLEDEVSGSLRETLVLRGSLGDIDIMVLFSSEILEHWPPALQASRLNEMRPFILAATERALRRRHFSEVSGLFQADVLQYLIVLSWADIAS